MSKSTVLTVTATQGIPGCGKTTWAKEQVRADKTGNTIIVCKDDLRAMLHDGSHSKHREKLVLSIRDAIILHALSKKQNVIVADTNFGDHIRHMRQLVFDWAEKNNAVVDFNVQTFDTSLAECIKRDALRPKPVGKEVILRFYRDYVLPGLPKYEPVPGTPKTVIFDLDGTLFDKSPHRGYYDWDKVHMDAPKPYMKSLLQLYASAGYRIVLLSGRDEKARASTELGLRHNGIQYDALFMRKADDCRSDDIVKRELFNKFIRNEYNVECVFDDRPKVVRVWHDMGLNVLSPNHPDFEF